MKGGESIGMTFEEQIQNAIDTLVDLCVYHDNCCDECEAKELCNCNKPADLLG